MIFQKFTVGVLVRLAMVFGLLVALSIIIGDSRYLFTQLVLGVLLVGLLVEFFRYVTKTNRDLSKFISAIEHQDFSVGFRSHGLGSAFDELHESFRSMLKLYHQNHIDKEEQFRFLQLIMDRLPIGLMVITAKGEIEWMNPSAQELTQLPSIASLDRLQKLSPDLAQQLLEMPQERFVTLEWSQRGTSISASVLKLEVKGTDQRTVLLFQDLKDAIEEAEEQAWLKLIRILTHEIMNSVTSISSLSSTALEMTHKGESQDRIEPALQSIKKRSEGMLGFVADYRRLTHVPKPSKKWVSALDFARQQVQTLQAQLEEKGIQVNYEGSEQLQVLADPDQLGQVMLNLLLNAVHALSETEEPELRLSVHKEGTHTRLSVTDNGSGISPEHQKDIFIPFFSTREDGSGIGLSLCRQIMRNHGGSISMRSQPGTTTFTLEFRDEASA